MQGPNRSPNIIIVRGTIRGAGQGHRVVHTVLHFLSFVPLALILSNNFLAFSHTIPDSLA